MTRIRVEGLTHERGGRQVLDNVDLSINAGEIIGLVGPNGAGKSSLMRLIAGLDQPRTGRVLVDGQAISSIGRFEKARLISYLAQGAGIDWPMRVVDVVALGRLPHGSRGSASSESDSHIHKAMATTDILDLRDRPADRLSGGETMRVLLARALAVSAPILLADEPVAALDPGHQLHTMEILQTTARDGAAVVVVLHDLTLASRFCDRLVLLHDGRVVANGAPSDALCDVNLRHAYGIEAERGTVDGREWLLPIRYLGRKG